LEQRFTGQDEDALVVPPKHTALAVELFSLPAEHPAEALAVQPSDAAATGTPLLSRDLPADQSVFVVNIDLMKGVAGRIFWR